MTTYQRKTQGRPSFTLTELVVVMAIIAIMMSMVAAAMSGAINDARKQRTVMIITKIDRLIMEKVNEYRFRAVRLQMPPSVSSATALQARYRLYALRDLMRMELPDRYSDFVTYQPSNPAGPYVPMGPAPLGIQEGVAVSLPSMPAATMGYLRQVQNNPRTPRFTKQFENAECLYLILSQMRDGDRTALANFSRDEIGDFDNDGMKEIWDGWGRPISFLRWAPGYVSNPPDWGNAPYVPAPSGPNSGYPALTSQSIIQQRPADGVSFFPELDQFESIDLLRLEPRWAYAPLQPTQTGSVNWQWRPFALRPLIFSNGPDKQADIRLTYDSLDPLLDLPNEDPAFAYSLTGTSGFTGIGEGRVARDLNRPSPLLPEFRIPTDPYVLIKNGTGDSDPIEPWIGACYDTNTNGRPEYVDNITNHAIELGGENNQ